MFYIYANGKSIYQPMDDSLSLFAPKLTLEMGKAGSLTFQIPPSNRYYNSLNQLSTVITVEMDDTEIFRGRVLTNNRSFNKVRTIYCEGNLAYLVDSVQKGEKYNGTAHDLFRRIIAAHNARVERSKQFAVGDITVEDREVLLAGKSDEIQDAETGKFDYRQIALNSIADEWMTSFDYIETTLINYLGGYLRTRRQNGTTYIDFIEDYGTTAVQEIEFGKNLLDLTEEVSAEGVFTVLIPLGDENLTIADVNNGSDELVDEAAVARYGRIVKTHVFDSVNTPETLLENGRRYLASNVNVPVTITVKAVDMHLIDPNASAIYLGDRVRVTSAPHDMTNALTCTRIEYDMENPANNSYTFGTPKPALTERYRKDKQKTSSGGGAGGAAGEVVEEEAQRKLDELFDAWIDVDKEAGHITLGTLYEKYKNDKTVLKNQVGIDLDAPSGNLNIKNLRESIDETSGRVTAQAARIDLINDETKAKIDLIVARSDSLEDLEAGHYASLSLRADENESAIEAKADKVTVDAMQIALNATKKKTDNMGAVLESTCGIKLDAEGQKSNVNIATLQNVVNTQGETIRSSSTRIDSLSTQLKSQITLEASHNTTNKNNIAAIKLTADSNASKIELKADKTYVESLIAEKIEAISLEVLTAKAKLMDVQYIITANGFYARNSMYIAGKKVATQEWVKETIGDAATQEWVKAQGYLDHIPQTLKVASLNATGSLRLDGRTVATMAWVKEQLAKYALADHTHSGYAAADHKHSDYASKTHNHDGSYANIRHTHSNYAAADHNHDSVYAKTDHTHSGYASSSHSHGWASITGKPTTFTPSSHKHRIVLNIANGHTHKVTVSGKSYTTAGVSTNASHAVDTYTYSN